MNSGKRVMRKYDGRKREWLRMAKLFVLLIVIVIVVFRFVIGYATVLGVSMLDTLHDHDVVIYTRLGVNPEKGDIVSVSLPSGEKYVKRVIATAGDTVDIRDGIFYINGEPEQGDYFTGPTLNEESAFAYPLTVEEGDIFVMGDNRPESIDSRFFGPISGRQISGVVRLRIRGWDIRRM